MINPCEAFSSVSLFHESHCFAAFTTETIKAFDIPGVDKLIITSDAGNCQSSVSGADYRHNISNCKFLATFLATLSKAHKFAENVRE